MKLSIRTIAQITGLAIASAARICSQDASPAAGAAARTEVTAWVFKPALTPYVEPNRPHWKLSDVLAMHAGKTDWAEPIVKDSHISAQYVSLGPGGKVLTNMETDTKMWFVVQAGQLRVDIKGVPSFTATKDFIVQVPMRTPFSMETVGDQPSLRFEVRIEGEARAFPVADNPSPPKAPAGYTTVKAIVRGTPEPYSDTVKPYLDFQTEFVKADKTRGPFFVSDARGFATVIRGKGVPVPPPSQLGHFHLGLSEFWMILEGEVDVQIEGVPDLVRAHDGDVVYAMRGRFHRATIGGTGMGTRLAMGGVTDSGSTETLDDGNR